MGWTILDTNKLRQIDLFAQLSEVALERLATITYTKNYRRGEKIFSDGAPGTSMFMIMSGEVRISKPIPGMGEEALAFLREGAYFGEMSLLGDDTTYSADAWAAKACRVTVMKKKDLLALMADDSELELELLRSFVATLSRRLRQANSKVTFLAAAGKFT